MLTTSRRQFVVASSATIAALTALQSSILAHAFPSQPGETVLPWLDQPPENPVPEVVANQLQWEQLNSWLTPNEQFFSIAHYDRPAIDAGTWKLEVGGLVERPLSFALDELKARPRQEVVFTVE